MKARRTIEDFRRDIAERRSTPGDEERKQNVLNHGRECLRRVKGDTTWEDWMGIGAALMVITEEAMKTVGVTAWNKDNKHLIREFNERWDEYEASALEQGSNQKPLSKQERWALREVMTNPEIGAWRSGLDGTNRRKLNHPNKVIERWRRATQTSDKEPKKPSPSLSQALKDRDKVIAELEARNTELGEELTAVRETAPQPRTLLDSLTEVVGLAENPASWPEGFPPKQAAAIAKALIKVRDAVAAGAPPLKRVRRGTRAKAGKIVAENIGPPGFPIRVTIKTDNE